MDTLEPQPESKPRSMSGREGEEQSRRGGMVTGAHNCDGCLGCQWADKHSGGWCHQFKHAPEKLPCAQHDCFAMEREITSAMIRKNPALVTFMVMDALDSPPAE
jgi:hypothetical protein